MGIGVLGFTFFLAGMFVMQFFTVSPKERTIIDHAQPQRVVNKKPVIIGRRVYDPAPAQAEVRLSRWTKPIAIEGEYIPRLECK